MSYGVHIDPERLGSLGPGIVQKTENAHADDEQKHDPMEGDGALSVAGRLPRSFTAIIHA
jgi:hypothetical protein